MSKAARLRALALAASKMAGILLDLFAPDTASGADGVEYVPVRCPLILSPPARYPAGAAHYG